MPILDQFGRPASMSGNGGGSPYESPEESSYYLPRPMLDKDVMDFVDRHKWRMLLSDARYIYKAFDEVGEAVRQKSKYVSGAGWTPQYLGHDKDWGNQAEELLHLANKYCNVRGPLYTFEKNMRLGCRAWDVDGDFFILPNKTPTGWPIFQYLQAHRLGSRIGHGLVQGGRYDGARCVNGLILNDRGYTVAYNVLGPTWEQDRQIPAGQIWHVANPDAYSDGRPLPMIANAVLSWYDVKETRQAERTSVKVNSALSIIEENEAGTGPPKVMVASGEKTKAGLQTELMERGLIRYIKSGKGKITAHTSTRPTDGWFKLDRAIRLGAFAGLGWRIEMIDPGQLAAGPARGVADDINRTIKERFHDLEPFALRQTLWQIACFIDRGDLAEHPDWFNWGFTAPPEYTMDQGHLRKAIRDDIEAGIESESNAIRRTLGMEPEDFYRDRAKNMRLRSEIEAEFDLPVGSLGPQKNQIGTRADLEIPPQKEEGTDE